MAASAAVAVAVALAALMLFEVGDAYTVRATFVNAGQIVKGNDVVVAGIRAGSVEAIEITPDGRAELTISVDERYAPLRTGTRAIVKQASQSGIANRYVELAIPPGGDDHTIPDGGRIQSDRTETAVDLDQLFNTLDPPTRRALRGFFQGSARMYEGAGRDANRGLRYFNPALSSTRRVLEELSHDTLALERFVVDSSQLVTVLASRRDHLAALVGNLNETTRAVGIEKAALAESIERFPEFMRRANTTFADLRGTLDEVDPLVDAARPAARTLGPFLEELRPLARDARPTVADLSRVVRTGGRGNDLVELTRTFEPIARIAVDASERNGGEREGAFGETARAARDSTPLIAFGRPYTPDLFGWFDDFSTPGVYDALGGLLRFQVVLNAFTVQGNTPVAIDLPSRGESFKRLFQLGEVHRCPGGAEARAPDGSNVFSEEEQERLECEESHRAVNQ